MKRRLAHMRILSDGRAGHQNQSLGLAEALRRRTGADVECVRLDLEGGFFARVTQACRLAAGGVRPQLLIAAGHRTHVPLLLAAWWFSAKAIVIMKPSLPVCFFDLCLVPMHDLRTTQAGTRIIATRGALNRLPETPPVKTETGVILIGGPSKHHGWDDTPVLVAIAEIVRRQSGLTWTVANSRRTPDGFLVKVAALGLPVETMPHEKTVSGWLPSVLMAAKWVWVTEDSTSMIFEAITAGAQVGLVPLPAKRPGSRMICAVDDVVGAGYAVRYADWLTSERSPAPVGPLHESARCADEILKRFFPVT